MRPLSNNTTIFATVCLLHEFTCIYEHLDPLIERMA